MLRVTSFLIFMIMLTTSAYADIDGDLSRVWNSLGGESVTNGARYYDGQKRGHYTMGSMYLARQKKNRPLVSVNFPEIDLDKSCYNQGVLNFGGFSFIKGNELKDKMQGIMQQAGMMFVYLGVSSISPVIGETLQEVYSKLQEVGGFLSDECQAAKQIVGFMGDKMTQHSEMAKDIFTKFQTSHGGTKDLSTAYGEYPRGKASALDTAASRDERFALENINIAWKALDKLGLPKELKEMMMTISGTVIIRGKGNSMPDVQYISSKVDSPDILKALLKGDSNMKVLNCSDITKCLNVTERDKFIDRKDSFEQRVSDYFDKFREALEEDIELEKGAQKFLAIAGLPAYRHYEVLYQYTNAHPEHEQGVLVEIVAWNILYNYLSDILKEVNEAASNLSIAATSELKEFKESIRSAQKLLSSLEVKDISRQKLQLFLIKRSESWEETMSNDMTQVINISQAGY